MSGSSAGSLAVTSRMRLLVRGSGWIRRRAGSDAHLSGVGIDVDALVGEDIVGRVGYHRECQGDIGVAGQIVVREGMRDLVDDELQPVDGEVGTRLAAQDVDVAVGGCVRIPANARDRHGGLTSVGRCRRFAELPCRTTKQLVCVQVAMGLKRKLAKCVIPERHQNSSEIADKFVESSRFGVQAFIVVRPETRSLG